MKDSSTGLPAPTASPSDPLAFTSYLGQVLLGQMLSDGHAEVTSGCSARLTWSFGTPYRSYALWLYGLISRYCKKGLYTVKTSGQLRLKTRSLPVFMAYHSLFYAVNAAGKLVKVVPALVLESMNYVVLAHLLMGDGSWSVTEETVFIYTNSYTYQDCLALANAITRLGVKTTVRKDKVGDDGAQQYRLAVSKGSVGALRAGVMPHMHDSMLFRVGL